MTTSRSRRLRKKLCVDKFQEPGFELNFHYKEGVGADAVNTFMLRFIDQMIKINELAYDGYNGFGFVCLARHGSISEEQRTLVGTRLKQQPELAGVEVGALIGVWCPEQPVPSKP